MNKLQEKILGLTLCLTLTLPAWCLGQLFPIVGAPVFAIFLGMLVSLVQIDYSKTKAGISFTSKYLLQFAVVLLGFGLNLTQVFAVGATALPIVLVTITTALFTAFFLQKLFKLDVKTATLIGVGSSICGGSAIAATAPVIQANEEEIVKSISVIFLFNILAALLFPSLGVWLGLSNDGFALFVGTAVNDTSSVTATATAWDAIHGANSLDDATIVKLTRTLAIIPITLGLSLYRTRHSQGNSQAGRKRLSLDTVVPRFILYFIMASFLTTVLSNFDVVSGIFPLLKTLSKFCIVMSMSAIGLNANPMKLVKTSGNALLVGGICWLAIILVSLGMQALLGIW